MPSLNEVGNFSHDKAVFAVASAGAGPLAASGTADGDVHVWDGTTVTEPAYLQGRLPKEVAVASTFVLRFAPDGTALLAAGEGWAGAARVAGKSVQDWTPVGPASGLAVNPDKTKLWAAVAVGKQVSVREVDTPKTRTFGAAIDVIQAIAWPAAQWIATAQGQQIALWDATGPDGTAPAQTAECPAAQAKLAGVPGGGRLASVDSGARPVVRVWLTPFGVPPGPRDAVKPVTAAAGVTAGPLLATGSGGVSAGMDKDQTIQILNGDCTLVKKFEPGRKSAITAVAFDPTGQQLAWADGENKVVLAQAVSPFTVQPERTRAAAATALALAGDRVAVGYGDGKIELLKASDAAAPPVVLSKHADRVNALAFSPDSADVLYSASDDQSALKWDLSGTTPSSEKISGIGSTEVQALAVAAGGPVAVGTAAGDVLFWAQDSLGAPAGTLKGESGGGGVSALAMAGNGRYLIAAQATSRVIRAWDLKTQLELQRFTKHTKAISALAVAAPAAGQPARLLSSASDDDKNLLAWNLAATAAFPANEGSDTAAANALAVTADRVLVGLANNKAFAIADDGSRKLMAHPGPVNALAPVAKDDGTLQLLFTGSRDQAVRAWDAAGTAVDQKKIDGLPEAPTALAVDAAGAYLAVGFGGADAQVYEVATKTLYNLPQSAHVAALAFLADRRLVTAPSDAGKPRLWETLVPTAALLNVLPPPATVSTFAAAWVPEGDQWGLVLGGRDSNGGTNTLRRIDSKGNKKEVNLGAGAEVRALAVSPDGQKRRLVSGGLDMKLTLWGAGSLDRVADVTPPASLKGSVVALAFHKDPTLRLLAAAYRQGQVGLWAVKADGTGIDFKSALDAHGPAVAKDVAFSPAGNLLASLGNDGVIKVLDISNPAAPPPALLTFTVPPGGTLTHQLAWSADGKFLVVAGSDHKAHVIAFTA